MKNFDCYKRKENFNLWSEYDGMNIAMNEKTEIEAYQNALEYVNKRRLHFEVLYRDLMKKLEFFHDNVYKNNNEFDFNCNNESDDL